MKNIQPDMDCARQIRKGNAARDAANKAGDHQKASYIAHLVRKMKQGIDDGQPQPWSQFAPMIAEEFGD